MSEKNQQIKFKDMLKVLFRRELYLDVMIILFGWVPVICFLVIQSYKINEILHLPLWPPFPFNFIIFVVFFLSGVYIVWLSYTYLVLLGEGSPCPQLGGTKKLVTVGPYAIVRHPSVLGKLLGVLSVGFLFRATGFLIFIVPLLLVISLFYNKFIQERGCIERFGQEYKEYKNKVPMIIPKIKFLRKDRTEKDNSPV